MPPRKYSEDPGRSVRAAATSPPVQDSATAMVSLRLCRIRCRGLRTGLRELSSSTWVSAIEQAPVAPEIVETGENGEDHRSPNGELRRTVESRVGPLQHQQGHGQHLADGLGLAERGGDDDQALGGANSPKSRYQQLAADDHHHH